MAEAVNPKPALTLSHENRGKSVYAVRDIYAAAFLNSMGFKIVGVTSNGFQAEFRFAGVSADVILGYYNEDSQELSAKKLFDSFQNMRRISRQLKDDAPDLARAQEVVTADRSYYTEVE